MKTETRWFEGEGFAARVVSVKVGSRIEVLFGEMRGYGFDATDLVARNLTIAELLRAGYMGKTVAELCWTSRAQVSMVKKTVEEGGLGAVVERWGRRKGRPAVIVGRRLSKARELRREGKTLKEIAKRIGAGESTVSVAVRGVRRGGGEEQAPLRGVGGGPRVESKEEARVEVDGGGPEELMPGKALPVGPTEHPCRYAGTLLVCAAVQELGLHRAIDEGAVSRPRKSAYDAHQAVMALEAAWAAGYPSLEAMHERDARALGVVLGLERSPCVRTMHRAIAQMTRVYDPVAFGAAVLKGLVAVGPRAPVGPVSRVALGVDGHVKAYFGPEPIDKGWDSKRRMAVRAVADVMVHDARGWTWMSQQVPAGAALSSELLGVARQLRWAVGDGQPIVLAFDRGGFSFETLNALDGEGFSYVTYVPATAKTGDLAAIAPAEDGVGESLWAHPSLSHRSRLLVERDGEALVPMATNLPGGVDATDAAAELRTLRGAQENGIKAARSFSHIDRLVDRGGATRAPDDRLVDNPERAATEAERKRAQSQLSELEAFHTRSAREEAERQGEILMAELEAALLDHQMKGMPKKVPRTRVDPLAQRAWLKTVNRVFLEPLKLSIDNGRRWLLGELGLALAPTDEDYDASCRPRTLASMIGAPGTVRFDRDDVYVTLEMPLPPTAHARIDRGLESLDARGLRFSDRRRALHFRLAPRPLRHTLPSAQRGTAPSSDSE